MEELEILKHQLIKEEHTKVETLKLVSFKIGEEEFAIDILLVQEIIKLMDITRVPRSPGYVEGVINLRGRVIPVINIRKRLTLPPREFDKDTKIVVIDLAKKTLGFIVDSVSEVIEIEKSTIEPPPSVMGEVDSQFISGVGKLADRLLVLMDLEKVLSRDYQSV